MQGSYLLADVNGYRFVAGPEVLDLAAFRDLVAAARDSAGDHPEEALDRYAEALRLGHGPSGALLADSVGATATFAAIDSEFCEACV